MCSKPHNALYWHSRQRKVVLTSASLAIRFSQKLLHVAFVLSRLVLDGTEAFGGRG